MNLQALLLSAVLLATGSQQDPKNYSNGILNVQFGHPANWQVTTSKKSESKVIMPIGDTGEFAILEVLPITFDSEKDIWQVAQKTLVLNSKRELIRQWEEEVLGVPLLLTKYSSANQTTLNGLLYADWSRKMFFRLSAPTAYFESAEFQWRQALETIRTVDGAKLKPNDPNAPRSQSGKKAEPVKAIETKVVVIDGGGPKASSAKRGEIEIPCEAANRKLTLFVPKGWSVTPNADGTMSLRHTDLSNSATLQVLSSLDSDPAQRALFVASSKSLGDFSKVKTRNEMLPTASPVGAMASRVVRVGEGGSGALLALEAVVQKDLFYVLITYRSNQARDFEEDQRTLDSLLQRTSIEPIP
jgi:hypothetical protein